MQPIAKLPPPPPIIAVPDTETEDVYAIGYVKENFQTVKDAVVRNTELINPWNAGAAAIAGVAILNISATTYFEYSRKRGWKWTRANRYLRWSNAIVPAPMKRDENGEYRINMKAWWSEMKSNVVEANNDKSYLVFATTNQQVLHTIALQRSGLEEDSMRASDEGSGKAAKTYKHYSEYLIKLAYEDDPAEAADRMALELETGINNYPTRPSWGERWKENPLTALQEGLSDRFINKFGLVPWYIPSVSNQERIAIGNVVARFRDTAARLREGELGTVSPSENGENLRVVRHDRGIGTYFYLADEEK